MKRWQIEFGKDIISKYNDGIGIVALEKLFGIPRRRIHDFVRKYNSELWRGRRVYELKNEDYFETIDAQNKAYLFGLICADGHVSDRSGSEGIVLEIQSRDVELLEMLRSELGTNKPIKETQKKNKTYKRLVILSTKMRGDIYNLGVYHDKTNTLTFPPIEKTLHSHFIRGFFDGDGCLCVRDNSERRTATFSIIATTKMCDAIALVFKEEVGVECIVKKLPRNSFMSNVFIYANNDIDKVFQYLYSNANLYLLRKFRKYEEFKTIINNPPPSLRVLSDDQVKEIRLRIARGETLRSIAKDYNITHGPISNIKRGKTYKSVISS